MTTGVGRRGVKYVSFHEPGGYGEAARRYMMGLRNAGVHFTWAPMVPGNGWRLGYQPLCGSRPESPLASHCNRSIDYDTVLLHIVPEYYPLWLAQERGKRMIGYTTWETDRPPTHWIRLLNAMHGIVVPCEWNRTVFRQHGVTVPIEVVPHIALNGELPSNRGADRFGLREGDWRCYAIGAWTARKAMDDTIRCFLDTFTGDDPAVMIVKTTPRDLTRRIWRRLRPSTRRAIRRIRASYRNPARMIVVTDDLSDEEMILLHAAGDCYLSLTHGEGWGLGAFDAAAMGRPVVMTGCGGPEDFWPPGVAGRVGWRWTRVQDPEGGRSYTPDQRWAKPDRTQASRDLREAFEDRAAATDRGRALKEYVRDHFEEGHVTNRLLRAIGYGD